MRNLNRIIFINSANIPYADDIYLDGNIHFIGTQGVGKSTILRAILFFYNADTQKLGIPVEKQSYTEYYFPYSNSYIVYEVATENGPFCILSFKSMNRVCYRFIDSPYRKEFFIDEESRTAYSGTDRIRAILDQYDVDYSRIIYTYDEYRNILYGNEAGADMQRYALMESKQYQNIPRTIQNVLLNSKLDAEFIKKTIISSLNEEDTSVDLNTYKEHLKNFETRLRDIEEFQKRETQKQAEEITRLATEVNRRQTALVQGCRELAAARIKAEEALPQWEEKKKQAENDRHIILARRMELQEQSKKKCDRLQEVLAVVNNELQKASQKEKEYDQLNISQIAERSAKKEEWKNRQQGLQEEQRILTSQYTEISTKYKLLIQSLDEQWNKIHEAKLKQQEELGNTYNSRMEEARKQHETATEALYQEYEQLSQTLHPEYNEKQKAMTALDYQIQMCHKETYFAAEQEELKHRIQSYTGLHLSKKNRIENAQLVIRELTLKWDEEQQKGFREKDERMEALSHEQKQLRTRIEELETFLQNSRNTLQGWLKDHKPGWEENIGKLCDESILWQTGLSPRQVDEGASFYGINLDLSVIERPIKSINDYQREKESHSGRMEEITSELQHLQADKDLLQEQLKAKYQPRIKEQKDIISVQQYELEKLEQQYQQDMLDIELWKKKEEEERNAHIAVLNKDRQTLQLELQEIDGKLKNLNLEKGKRLNELKQQWNDQQQQIADERNRQAEQLKNEDRLEQQRITAEKNNYESQMNRELHSQGADTERLQSITSQLNEIEAELQFIKNHATLLIEYQKDKRDLIDRIPVWKREQEEQKQLLSQEKESLKKENAILQEQLDRLDKELKETDNAVRDLHANLDAYAKIAAYDWYKPHQDILGDTGRAAAREITPRKSCIELIEELGRDENQFLQLQTGLRKEINLFTGHFDEDNTFKFATKFNDDWEYLRFAEELNDFIRENKINEFIRRINNEHSDVFKRISMDTSMLTASEKDIHDIISKVNKGFQTCNFVGVIQRIEMKVEESSNRVVNALRAIRKYYNEHAHDLAPGTNLFSSENEQLVKQEAIALLRDFIKEIHAYRYDTIRLYDSFELRFRIVENNNDTGFVEKLSNVGSEGTDILVKAMINIMLLYVFKEGASRKFKDFKLHCMMDEIGKLHPNNVNGILKFANDRNIILINGSPTELNRDTYKHVYLLTKGAQSKTRIARLISDQKL